MRKHKTTKLKIRNKFYPIDINILDIVKWLNSYNSVTTLYSCEGDKDRLNSPYILFTCKSVKDLRKIIHRFSRKSRGIYNKITKKYHNVYYWDFGHIEVNLAPDNNIIRYHMIFKTIGDRENFKEMIKGNS